MAETDETAYSEEETEQRWRSYPYPQDSWYSYPSPPRRGARFEGGWAEGEQRWSAPSLWPTVVITFCFGAFGVIPAVLHSQEARQHGSSSGRYWVAFALAFAAGVLVWSLALLIIFSSVSHHAVPGFPNS